MSQWRHKARGAPWCCTRVLIGRKLPTSACSLKTLSDSARHCPNWQYDCSELHSSDSNGHTIGYCMVAGRAYMLTGSLRRCAGMLGKKHDAQWTLNFISHIPAIIWSALRISLVFVIYFVYNSQSIQQNCYVYQFYKQFKPLIAICKSSIVFLWNSQLL